MVPKKGEDPFLQELVSIEVEPLEVIVEPSREQFYTVRSQERRLDTLTTFPDEVEMAALWAGETPANRADCCCCCCCPACCCC